MKQSDQKQKQAILRVEFHWTGDIPKKLKKTWEAMFKPRTVKFTIPKGAK